MSLKDDFLINSEKKASDGSHRQKINFNIGKYDTSVVKGKKVFSNLDLARSRANLIKKKAIDALEENLIEFEAKFNAKGGKVLWAVDSADAIASILKIAKKHKTKTVVKSKSMVTEEIHLNKHLELNNIEVFETDLGEFIVQLNDEPPYHIVTPAMHLSKEDVADIYHRKLNTAPNLTPSQIMDYTRDILRDKYFDAEIGITGANFIIAKDGAISITENEGNARLSFTTPKVHIAIVGIEKVIPTLEDLDLFWPLLAVHGTGQKMTVYNSLIFGPRKANEYDGPEEMYVIILDNGRSKVLADPELRTSLYCIRCGACLNACPVYKNIGGHAYKTTYSGPIGAVISPHLNGTEEYKHLSQASSLCGNCTEVCPVKIELHKLLLLNRRKEVEAGTKISFDNIAWKFWKIGMLNRKIMNIPNAKAKNFVFKKAFSASWGNRREALEFPDKSFNERWRELHPALKE